jgi:murein DD-endopeptidase MepM/ murein hydrolase activator NlpD
MAKTTVEILGGQLDGTILSNMASEATMRELLSAIKSESKSSGGGRAGGNSSSYKLSKSTGLVTKLTDTLGNQLGNMIGAVGSMGAMLLTGNTKMSSYTRALNDQVISKLPVVGGLLGGLGGIVNDSIEVFEEWNDALKTGTETGATFGNSILRAAKSATSAAMDLDSYMRMVNSNSSVMLNLGNTVTQGAERFSKISRLLNRDGGIATQTLRQMGMNAKDVNEGLINYIDIMGGGILKDKKSDLAIAENFEKFQLNLMKLTSLTGKSNSKLQDQMAVASKDIVFKMALNKLDEKERTKMMTSLAHYTAMYGESGAELFKSLFLGMPPGDEDARNLFVLMPDLVRSMKGSISSATDKNITVEKFNDRIETDVIKAMLASAKSANGLDQLLATAGAGYGDSKAFLKGINPILEQLSKYGDISKLNEAELRKMFKKAKDEQKARDEITKFLNDFEMAMQDLKFGMMEFLFPLLDDLGKTLEKQDLPGKVKEFGTFLKDSVDKYLPDVITFFKYLGDENGREFIWNEMAYFFDKMGIHFKYYMKSILGLQSSEELTAGINKELNDAMVAHEGKQSRVREKGLPPAYTGPAKEGGLNRHGKPIGSIDQPYIDRSNAAIQAMTQDKIPKFKSALGGTMQSTSDFGKVRPDHTHQGRDYAGNIGDKIFAPHGGTIKFGVQDGGLGNYVEITQGKLRSLLGHMHGSQDLWDLQKKFKPNQSVDPGTHVGFVGSSGSSTGPHLHWQTYYNDQLLDPAKYMERHKTGTLGNYSKLFRNYGSGTNVILDEVEAVMTPEQMNAILPAANNIATTELLESLDRNFVSLTTLMTERNSLSRQQLSYIEQNQVNIA